MVGPIAFALVLLGMVAGGSALWAAVFCGLMVVVYVLVGWAGIVLIRRVEMWRESRG